MWFESIPLCKRHSKHKAIHTFMPNSIRLIDRDLLASLVPMSKAIDLMKPAFAQLSRTENSAQVPIRAHLKNQHHTESLYMPVSLEDCEAFGVKIVGMSQANEQRGLPFISAMVLVLDGHTGRVTGMIEGSYLTALRTGAASGLATDLLANPEANVLAVFGAGVQARTQVEAVAAVRPLKKVWVFNRTRSHAETFAQEMSASLGIEMQVAEDPNRLAEAQIICTATTASTPIFEKEQLAPGAHINAVGAYRKDMAEIHPEVVKVSELFVDQVAATLVEAGDVIQPIEAGLISHAHILAELGEVVLDTHPGRSDPEAITLFKSVGNAVQDLSVADYALTMAEQKGVGLLIPW